MKQELSDIELSKGKILVDFYADWCGPCKMQGEILKEIENEISYKIIKINVDDNHNLTKKYGILTIPTILLFENGELMNKKVGLTTREELLKILK